MHVGQKELDIIEDYYKDIIIKRYIGSIKFKINNYFMFYYVNHFGLNLSFELIFYDNREFWIKIKP